MFGVPMADGSRILLPTAWRPLPLPDTLLTAASAEADKVLLLLVVY